MTVVHRPSHIMTTKQSKCLPTTPANLNIPRFKVVVQTVIGQMKDQGIRVASRCLWDTSTDNYAAVSYKNVCAPTHANNYIQNPLIRLNNPHHSKKCSAMCWFSVYTLIRLLEVKEPLCPAHGVSHLSCLIVDLATRD